MYNTATLVHVHLMKATLIETKKGHTISERVHSEEYTAYTIS